ncbi:DUF6221 family protein [Rhodococcus sp. T9N]|uniref:DUF6221 family protein n=1 Tax=Rhodococcus sp. T9N TaxID=627445 RepID=UPI0021C375E2|nr:DUF6221 family protein [Rhodococcus sp. T9N]
MGIVEFLEARIAEDEAVAKMALHYPRHFHEGGITAEQTLYMARHNPARALREVVAKRELLELHYDDNPGPGDVHYCGTCHDYYKHDAEDWPCETARVLASAFSDHPDFNEEWRP